LSQQACSGIQSEMRPARLRQVQPPSVSFS
jgi:hypothetical protein